jgi:hypothetical protein
MTMPDAPKSKSEPSKPDPGKPHEAVEASLIARSTADLQDLDGKKKKKKRKDSRGLREVQTVERDLAKASRRVARAVASGIGTYYQRDKKSSRKKRDGAIKDALKNWAKGLGKTARRSSGVPYDIAKAFDTKTFRRNLRATVRFIAPPFLR